MILSYRPNTRFNRFWRQARGETGAEEKHNVSKLLPRVGETIFSQNVPNECQDFVKASVVIQVGNRIVGVKTGFRKRRVHIHQLGRYQESLRENRNKNYVHYKEDEDEWWIVERQGQWKYQQRGVQINSSRK